MKHLALLCGINVSGDKMIKMEELLKILDLKFIKYLFHIS
jgi:uncharacterized protein (DUF1697 family)